MTASASAFDHSEHESIAARSFKFALVAGLHVALAAWGLRAQPGTPPGPAPLRIDVRTIELPAKRPQDISRPVVRPPKPLPQAAERPAVRRPASVPTSTPAVPAVPDAAPAAAPASFDAAPPQAAPAREEAPPEPAPVALTAARFDVGYLHNPAPVFPPLSRKLREEGKVQLLVQVSAKGEADSVQLKQGSGYSRLDEAAMTAVRKWRFIPARRGNEPVASSVVVPLVFRLDS